MLSRRRLTSKNEWGIEKLGADRKVSCCKDSMLESDSVDVDQAVGWYCAETLMLSTSKVDVRPTVWRVAGILASEATVSSSLALLANICWSMINFWW